MADYRFLTTWLLESPREPVWDAIYDREVALDDTVTVVRFSQIVENPPDFQDRLRGVGGAQN